MQYEQYLFVIKLKSKMCIEMYEKIIREWIKKKLNLVVVARVQDLSSMRSLIKKKRISNKFYKITIKKYLPEQRRNDAFPWDPSSYHCYP